MVRVSLDRPQALSSKTGGGETWDEAGCMAFLEVCLGGVSYGREGVGLNAVAQSFCNSHPCLCHLRGINCEHFVATA